MKKRRDGTVLLDKEILLRDAIQLLELVPKDSCDSTARTIFTRASAAKFQESQEDALLELERLDPRETTEGNYW